MMTSSHQIPRRIKPPSPSTAIKCPRCESMNTKFCYYNNYSLSQPRHFCKNCRRYWTRGGSLRNIPIGGSTRQKNKLSGDSFPPLFSLQTTSYSPVISSGGFSSFSDPNFVSLNQDLLRKIQQQRFVTSMFLQDSSPVIEKPLTAPVTLPAPVMISPLAGWGFETGGNNENSGNAEGNLGNWYCNGMP